jgi:hypothetical protein
MAIELDDGKFKVLATENYDPDAEQWEFPPGSIVRCRYEELSVGTNPREVLVARWMVESEP